MKQISLTINLLTKIMIVVGLLGSSSVRVIAEEGRQVCLFNGKATPVSYVNVYTTNQIDGKLTNIDSIMKSLIATAKTESVAQASQDTNAKIMETKNQLSESFQQMELKLLAAIQNLDQRILAEEVMKNMREQIKAELMVEVKESLLRELKKGSGEKK